MSFHQDSVQLLFGFAQSGDGTCKKWIKHSHQLVTTISCKQVRSSFPDSTNANSYTNACNTGHLLWNQVQYLVILATFFFFRHVKWNNVTICPVVDKYTILAIIWGIMVCNAKNDKPTRTCFAAQNTKCFFLHAWSTYRQPMTNCIFSWRHFYWNIHNAQLRYEYTKISCPTSCTVIQWI